MKALIGLGSNSGDRKAYLENAVAKLRGVHGTKLVNISRWHGSKPAGGPSQEEYLNGAAIVETTLRPEELLKELQRIETELGRVRDVRWGARTIDLDLLLFGEREINLPELTVPHPRMAYRKFVLAPACEIAGDWLYPVNGVSLAALLEHQSSSPHRIAVVGATNFERLAIEVRRDHPTWDVVPQWRSGELLRLVVVTHPYDGPPSPSKSGSDFDRRRREPSSPPVLWLPQCDEGTLLQEVLAAIAAME